MGIEKIQIEQFLSMSKQHPVFDVRSPGEYKHAHIPGSHSLPLFTDEERKVVGTAYKQKGREQAIKIGLDFFGPKMVKMVEEVESIVKNQKSGVNSKSNDSDFLNQDSRLVLIYCWRGGMRSAGVAWLLDLYGFKVYTLTGGYKKFRNDVLDTFKIPFQFQVLGGYTGSGKTELLKTLKEKREPVIDLEKIANHKGSAFGNIGLPPQPTQEMFENLLCSELRKHLERPSSESEAAIWLEDESQRIGLNNIPNDIWKNMRRSPVFFLNIPFEERLKHIADEYGCLDKQKMIEAIIRIKEKLGGLNAKKAIELLEGENTIESFRILLNYYDKYYFKSLHNREGINSLLHTIDCNSVTSENANQLILYSQSRAQTA